MKTFAATVSRNRMDEQQSLRGQIKVYSEQLGISSAEESVHWIMPFALSQGMAMPAIPKPGDTVKLLAETDLAGDIDWDHVWWMHAPMTNKEGEDCPEELRFYYPDIGWWYVDGNLVAISSMGGNKFVLIKNRQGKGQLIVNERVFMGTIPDMSSGLAAAVAQMVYPIKKPVALFLSPTAVVGSTVLFSD